MSRLLPVELHYTRAKKIIALKGSYEMSNARFKKKIILGLDSGDFFEDS